MKVQLRKIYEKKFGLCYILQLNREGKKKKKKCYCIIEQDVISFS